MYVSWWAARADRSGRARGNAESRRCARAAGEATQPCGQRFRARHRGPLPRAAGDGDAAERRTARRSSSSPAPGSARRWPAPTCCTASGCAARPPHRGPRSSCGPPTTCSTAIGMEAFAERARRELSPPARRCADAESRPRPADRARGPHRPARPRRPDQLRRSAPSSSSVPRTVEWHLRKVFTKLGIGSRRELRAALARLADATAYRRLSGRRSGSGPSMCRISPVM